MKKPPLLKKFRSGGQCVKKVEVQEALPPAGVLGAEPLSLMPQHSSREPAKRCSRAHAVDQGFFDSLIVASEEIQERRFYMA